MSGGGSIGAPSGDPAGSGGPAESFARFVESFRFELAFYLRRISTWAYFGVFLSLGLLLGHVYGGAFESVTISVGGASDTVPVNSPWAITHLTGPMSLFGILAVAALAGHAGYRDHGDGIHPLFHTTRVTPWEQLGGRYLASVLLGTFVVSGMLVGLAVCPHLPWLESEVFGPNRLSTYVVPGLVFVLPNVALTAAIFLSVAALTRARLPHYVGGLALFVGYMVGGDLLDDLGDEWIAALVDPFGLRALAWRTRYWTAFEQASLQPGFDPWILGNRALWLTVSLVAFAALVSRVRFDHDGLRLPGRRRSGPPPAAREPVIPAAIVIPAAQRRFGAADRLAQLGAITRRTFLDMLANAYFGAILLGAMGFLGITASQIGEIYGTPTWPVTYMILEGLGGTFGLFVIIILTFYAGELVWHERDLGVHQITDTMPVPSWIPWAAKMIAMFAMMAALLVVVIAVGVVTSSATATRGSSSGSTCGPSTP